MCDAETDTIEVELPGEVLDEIDTFAARNGYATPGAVVSEALRRAGANRHVQDRTP